MPMPAYIVLSIIAAPFTFWLWGASLEVFLGSGKAMPLDVFWAHYKSHPIMWVLTIPMGMGAVAIGYLLARFLRGKSVAVGTRTTDPDGDNDEDGRYLWTEEDAREDAEIYTKIEAKERLKDARESLVDAQDDIAHWERVVGMAK